MEEMHWQGLREGAHRAATASQGSSQNLPVFSLEAHPTLLSKNSPDLHLQFPYFPRGWGVGTKAPTFYNHVVFLVTSLSWRHPAVPLCHLTSINTGLIKRGSLWITKVVKNNSNEDSKGTRNSVTGMGDENQVNIFTALQPGSSLPP